MMRIVSLAALRLVDTTRRTAESRTKEEAAETRKLTRANARLTLGNLIDPPLFGKVDLNFDRMNTF
jgi:hypothetical protein